MLYILRIATISVIVVWMVPQSLWAQNAWDGNRRIAQPHTIRIFDATGIALGREIRLATMSVQGIVSPLDFDSAGHYWTGNWNPEDTAMLRFVSSQGFLERIILPNPMSDIAVQDAYSFSMPYSSLEYYYDGEGRHLYRHYPTFICMILRDDAKFDNISAIVDSLGLRPLNAKELWALGSGDGRTDAVLGGWQGLVQILVKKGGGTFGRMNCKELRILRSSPDVQRAGPLLMRVGDDYQMMYDNELFVRFESRKSRLELDSIAKVFGLRITGTADETPGGSPLIRFRADDGVCEGLWEIADLLSTVSGIKRLLFSSSIEMYMDR
ncbi:MAG: hypothetical protein ABIQ57_00510 [Candidatus Kapaibacterium sp.]